MEYLFIAIVLQLKHFVFDFVTQGEYQWKNKGTWMHPGGLLHSGMHSVFTIVFLASLVMVNIQLTIGFIVIVGVSEFIIHYLTDLAKVKVTRYYGLTAINGEKFWWLTGFDQLIHQLTYIGIIGAIYAVLH